MSTPPTQAELSDQLRNRIERQEVWIERAKQYLGAAYDNDLLVFSEGPEFLKGPQ